MASGLLLNRTTKVTMNGFAQLVHYYNFQWCERKRRLPGLGQLVKWLLAAQKSLSFKSNGNYLPEYNFQYLKPANHSELLKKVDWKRLILCFCDSLDISLRLDGSVDQHQNHNVYVEWSILCQSMDILPHISSDLMFRKMAMLMNACSVWKISLHRAHRIHLAFKSICSITVIQTLINDATNLSTFSYRYGERTNKLKTAAAFNHLATPLCSPKYFAVGWVQFICNLSNVLLRNWRATMSYFQSERIWRLS